VLRRQREGVSNHIVSDFRKCTEDDFINNGYTHETLHELEYQIDNLLCPDISKLKEFYNLTNSYTENRNKDSFALEIIKCNKDEKGEGFCANDDDIRELVGSFIFT